MADIGTFFKKNEGNSKYFFLKYLYNKDIRYIYQNNVQKLKVHV